ncbi:flavoprotein [Alishewanella longhuensis]
MTEYGSAPRAEITLAFTGASGAPYGWRLLELLLAQQIKVHLLISSAARVVFATEHDIKLAGAPDKCTEQLVGHFHCAPALLSVYGKDDWFSPVASGSAAPKKMVVCPCSTGTLSAIAQGASDNLIERAADVVLKEGGVFYSLTLLPGFWQQVAALNPIVYMVNAFRYGFLGYTDVSLWLALAVVVSFIVVLFSYAMYLINKGIGLRS